MRVACVCRHKSSNALILLLRTGCMGVLYGCAYARYVYQSVWSDGAKDRCTRCSCVAVMGIFTWAVTPQNFAFLLSFWVLGLACGMDGFGVCTACIRPGVCGWTRAVFVRNGRTIFWGVWTHIRGNVRARKSPFVIKSYEQGGFEMDCGGLSALRLTRNNPSPSGSIPGRQIRWRLSGPVACRR